MKKILKYLFYISIIIAVLSIATSIYCYKKIDNFAIGKTFDQIDSVRYNRVGLLLGTSRITKQHINAYYKNRIDATITLFNHNKIDYLIISGDNGNRFYNEPLDMKTDLINAGIDSNKIYLDYAGFRTFDSMKRLKEVFGQTHVTLISQQFHNERAIYIGHQLGIEAIGYNAKNIVTNGKWKTEIREVLARVKVFVDFAIGTEAKFLGNKIIIGT